MVIAIIFFLLFRVRKLVMITIPSVRLSIKGQEEEEEEEEGRQEQLNQAWG